MNCAGEHETHTQIVIAIVAMVVVNVRGAPMITIATIETVAVTIVVRSLCVGPSKSLQNDASFHCHSSSNTPQSL